MVFISIFRRSGSLFYDLSKPKMTVDHLAPLFFCFMMGNLNPLNIWNISYPLNYETLSIKNFTFPIYHIKAIDLLIIKILYRMKYSCNWRWINIYFFWIKKFIYSSRLKQKWFLSMRIKIMVDNLSGWMV